MNLRDNSQKTRLPGNLRPLFWSYRFEELEPEKDEKTIIIQLINYGSLTHWRWLVRQYGTAKVTKIHQSIPATEIKPRTLRARINSFFHPQLEACIPRRSLKKD